MIEAAGKQPETAAGACILLHLATVQVSNCDLAVYEASQAAASRKKSRVPGGTRDFQILGWL